MLSPLDVPLSIARLFRDRQEHLRRLLGSFALHTCRSRRTKKDVHHRTFRQRIATSIEPIHTYPMLLKTSKYVIHISRVMTGVPEEGSTTVLAVLKDDLPCLPMNKACTAACIFLSRHQFPIMSFDIVSEKVRKPVRSCLLAVVTC